MANINKISTLDYSFGTILDGRKFGVSGRIGFNSKENDNEVKGVGNSQDYGMRIYDSRLGKFLSVDPITKQYPELTPYQFASNRPIDGIDRDGLEYTKNSSFKLVAQKYQIPQVGVFTSVDVIKTASTPAMFDKNLPVHYSETGDHKRGSGTIYATQFAQQPDAPEDGVSGKDGTNYYLPADKTKVSPILWLIQTAVLPAVDYAINKEKIDANTKLKEDAKSFNMAHALVNKSINNYKLNISEQTKADLINYVNDGSLPSLGADMKGKTADQIKATKAYDSAIKKMGDIIYADKDKYSHATKQDKDYIKTYGD